MDITQAKQLLYRKHKNPGAVFNTIVEEFGYVAAPGCHDGMSANIVRMTRDAVIAKGGKPQCNAAYGSGWGASTMLRYLPDMGFHDRTEIIRVAQNICEGAYPLPVIMDAERGFGPKLAVPLLVRGYVDAGVAVAHFEDQPEDRRCGHLGGKEIDDLLAFMPRMGAAILMLEAMDSDMLLMGRTDAHDAANGSPEEAFLRGREFAEFRIPGCKRKIDLIWCEFATPDPGLALEFSQEMRRADPNVRLAINFSPNMDQAAWFRKFKVEPATYEKYAAMGYVLQFHTVWSAKVAMQHQYDWTLKMMENGAFGMYDFQDQLRGHPTASGQTMSRATEYQELEKMLGGEKALEKYERSKGFGSHGDGSIHDVDATENTKK